MMGDSLEVLAEWTIVTWLSLAWLARKDDVRSIAYAIALVAGVMAVHWGLI